MRRRPGQLKRRGERVSIEIRDDVIHGKGTFRQVTKLGELSLELVGWTVPRAETAERSGVGHRGRQPRRCEDAHPGLDDWKLNTDQVTQRRAHPIPFQSTVVAPEHDSSGASHDASAVTHEARPIILLPGSPERRHRKPGSDPRVVDD